MAAIIPFDAVRQFTAQPVREPTTVRVYPGADGQFRWYEDERVSQEYLAGESAWTRLRWDDAAKRFTIERDATSGALELPLRKLVVELVPEGRTQEVQYDGRRVEVGF